MANITASTVNELRKRTGVGMMDCKKALVECDGDIDKAIDHLREKGQKLASKRADREASEGCVLASTTENKTFGALIIINCETDFVAKNDDFIDFTRLILDKAIEAKVKNIEEVKTLVINGFAIKDNTNTAILHKIFTFTLVTFASSPSAAIIAIPCQVIHTTANDPKIFANQSTI